MMITSKSRSVVCTKNATTEIARLLRAMQDQSAKLLTAATEDAGSSTKTDTSGSSASLDSASGNNESGNDSGNESSKTHIAHQTSQHKVKTGLGAIMGAIAWFLKRKKRQSAAQTPQTTTTAQPPLDPAAPTYEVQHIHAAPSTSFYPVPQAHPQDAAYSQPPIFEAYGSPGNIEEGRYSATKVPAAHELPVGRT
ncbi:hypothetical protein FBULB1_11332 [Fusarium bulbicola]|nr:hypothetical protein FBULB1_11332 [Fusarium bulbicola]